MPHELEYRNGKTSFAYNGAENPWHRLGQPMDGLQTAEVMLSAAQADYEVGTAPLYVLTDEGMTEVESHQATFRTLDGTPQVLGVVGSDYQVVQNRQALDIALQVVSADPDEAAVVDTCGVLYDGKRFFAYIDLGTLDIDPLGVNDRVSRGLGVLTSHDGTQAVTFAMSNIRWVCNNTVTAGLQRASSVFRVRHTRNVQVSLAQARTALGIAESWAERFTREAETLLRVNDGSTVGYVHDVLTRLEKELWPIGDDPTTRVFNNAERRRDSLHAILDSPTCIPAVGANGWAVYNAVTEFIDHARTTVSAERRAEAAILGTSDTLKIKAANLLIASDR